MTLILSLIDYYDALDYENKRKTTPTRGTRREKSESRSSGRTPKSRDGSDPPKPGRGRPPGRATLTWKKGKGQDDDEDERDRRRRKRPRNNEHDEDVHMMDDLSPEKSIQCRVSLSEINRKMGFVMMQPI